VFLATQRTSLLRLAQKLLLIYRLLPFSTTSLPKRFSSPSTLLSKTTLGSEASFGFVLPLENGHSGWPASDPFSLSAASCSCSSTWAFKLDTTPSKRRSRSNSSASAGFRLLRGARPGPGKMHSILARVQLEQGCLLSHLTCTRGLPRSVCVRCWMCTQTTHLSPAACHARPGVRRGTSGGKGTANAALGSKAGLGRVVRLRRVFRHGANVSVCYCSQVFGKWQRRAERESGCLVGFRAEEGACSNVGDG
jgi:hypothetical protein